MKKLSTSPGLGGKIASGSTESLGASRQKTEPAAKRSTECSEYSQGSSKKDRTSANSYTASAATAELEHKLAESTLKKKPANADCLDVQRLWDALRAEIVDVKKDGLLDTHDSCENLRNWISSLEGGTKAGIAEVSEEIKHLQASHLSSDREVAGIKEELARIQSDYTQQLHHGFSRLDVALESLFSEVEKLRTDQAESTLMFQSSMDGQASRVQETNDSIGAVQHSMDKSLAAIRRELSESTDESSRQIAAARARQETLMLERLEIVTTDAAKSRVEIQKQFSNVTDTAFNVLDAKLDQAMHSQKFANEESKDQLRHECKRDIEELQQEVQQLCRATSCVANIPTRRVEWVIREASAKFRSQIYMSEGEDDLQAGDDIAILSRPFEMAGSKALQLELIRFGGPNSDIADNRDCCLRLMAEKGLRLVFSVFVGDAVHQIEHTFNGEEPFSSGRLCALNEQIQQSDDTLHVGLEVLEASLCVEGTSSLATMGVQELDDPVDSNDRNTFIFHRHMNNRMLDLVQDQVDTMNSRMTRRVEWRVERASRLANCFSEGEAMCSTTFQAAGLDGLQFVFYPCGSFGAKEGYCSCFLYYPGRAMLRCWLSVGSQRREAKVSLTSSGFFGRSNFCKLDVGTDSASDTVTLVLEIDEARQDVVTRHANPVTSQSVNSPPPGATSTMLSSSIDTTVESSLRLQKTSGHLQEVKLLPSIWTPTPQAASVVEGFHNMKDLPTKKRSNGRGAPQGGAAVRPGTVSSMSMYSQSDLVNSRPESRQMARPGSRAARSPSPTDRQGNLSAMSMYSDSGIQACPPASARPVNRPSARDALSARYAAYMG